MSGEIIRWDVLNVLWEKPHYSKWYNLDAAQTLQGMLS